jgi:hypothetical protein
VNVAFEEALNSDEDLHRFSGRMFYVWDDNLRLQAWMPYISKVHPCDFSWHIVISDGHDPLDTWPIPQPAVIFRASPAVASRSAFAQPAVANRSLSELSRGHRAAATARLRGGHSHLLVVEPIIIPAEIVISFIKTKFLLVDFPVLDNSVCCC